MTSLLTTEDTVAMLSDLGRKDEAITELRRSVKTLDEMARANPDTPASKNTISGSVETWRIGWWI